MRVKPSLAGRARGTSSWPARRGSALAGLSTAVLAAVNELKKEIARRNEEAQAAARKKRAAREKAHLANLRKWEQL